MTSGLHNRSLNGLTCAIPQRKSERTEVLSELQRWKEKMKRRPSFLNRHLHHLQVKINRMMPEKIHRAMTTAIKQMTRAMLTGARLIDSKPLKNETFAEREARVREKIRFYSNTAAAEGALTGAGGLLLGLADFPAWLALKMKMLSEIASVYGANLNDFSERLYLLHIFQLTFSSQQHRNKVFAIMENWKQHRSALPADIHEFDWRNFQQEYRDYIDIAKLMQLVPGIGAVVGAVVNKQLTEKLGFTAMNAYRLRLFEK